MDKPKCDVCGEAATSVCCPVCYEGYGEELAIEAQLRLLSALKRWVKKNTQYNCFDDPNFSVTPNELLTHLTERASKLKQPDKGE